MGVVLLVKSAFLGSFLGQKVDSNPIYSIYLLSVKDLKKGLLIFELIYVVVALEVFFATGVKRTVVLFVAYQVLQFFLGK